jgi:hypothetical protein
MRIKKIAAIGTFLVLLYSATLGMNAGGGPTDVCCNDGNDCTSGYACDKSGDTCEPTLTGRCIKIPE